MPDVLLIGATGFTGRLIAKYLTSHPQATAFSWGIAGRSQAKLDALAEELDLPSSVEISVVNTTDAERLGKVVKEAKVVICAAGPFPVHGTPVIRACAEHGVHYVDISAGPHWIKDIISEFHEKASKTKTMIINSCAFLSLPSDLSVYLARRTLSQHATGLEMEASVTGVECTHTTSGGSIVSVLDLVEASSEDRAVVQMDHVLSPVLGAPSPPQRLLYELMIPGEKQPLVGGTFPTHLLNRSIVQRTAGLLQLSATQNPVQTYKPVQALAEPYGKNFTYTEFKIAPTRFQGILGTLSLLLFDFLISFALVRWAFRKLVPSPGEGASDEELESGKYKTWVTNLTTGIPRSDEVEGRAAEERVYVKTTMRMNADAYVLSAALVAESALSIVLDYQSLTELGKAGGVLTPMAALGNVIIDRLKEVEWCEIESEVVRNGRDKDL